MIRITIEMVPGGIDAAAYTIAQGVIVNDGHGTQRTGNYHYGITRQRKRTGPEDPGIWKRGHIESFPRKRQNIWYLLKRVLDDALDIGEI